MGKKKYITSSKSKSLLLHLSKGLQCFLRTSRACPSIQHAGVCNRILILTVPTYIFLHNIIYIHIYILIEFSSCMFMSNSVKSKAGNPTLEVSILSRDFKSWECFISKGRICTHCTPFVVIRLCPNTGPCHLTLLGNLNRFGVSSCLFHNIADRATDYEVCHF